MVTFGWVINIKLDDEMKVFNSGWKRTRTHAYTHNSGLKEVWKVDPHFETMKMAHESPSTKTKSRRKNSHTALKPRKTPQLVLNSNNSRITVASKSSKTNSIFDGKELIKRGKFVFSVRHSELVKSDSFLVEHFFHTHKKTYLVLLKNRNKHFSTTTQTPEEYYF